MLIRRHRHGLDTLKGIITSRQRCLSRPFSSQDGASDSLIYPDPPSKHHHDLATFLSYAKRVNLDPDSTVYRGTHYEYTVAESLSRYGFSLRRVGGAGDAGIDLIGTWTLSARPTRVIVQCKLAATKNTPRYVRELEGAFVGAPWGWSGSGVLGLLVSTVEATRGAREALGRGRRPMGYLMCGEDGGVRQMLWNRRAEEGGLEGYGVVVRRFEDGRREELALTRNGVPLPLRG